MKIKIDSKSTSSNIIAMTHSVVLYLYKQTWTEEIGNKQRSTSGRFFHLLPVPNFFPLVIFNTNTKMGIAGVWYWFIGGGSPSCSMELDDHNRVGPVLDELVGRALRAVFGMDSNGRIKKEKAKLVVEKLGLMHNEEGECSSFDLPNGSEGDELQVEEVLNGMKDGDEAKRVELLREAFIVFDKDGDGYIEAMELKRVLECLGLDKGWGMEEIQKMVQVVDLNLDGKVDFSEFELMMG